MTLVEVSLVEKMAKLNVIFVYNKIQEVLPFSNLKSNLFFCIYTRTVHFVVPTVLMNENGGLNPVSGYILKHDFYTILTCVLNS